MESPKKKAFTFHRFGENALLVNFEQQIEKTINEQVINLNKAVLSANLPAVTFTIPAYCSLTIGYNATLLEYETLCLLISNLSSNPTKNLIQTKQRQLLIPICYDQEFALDLKEVAKKKGIAEKEIIRHHSTPLYKVYMLGFLPGFTFMGKVPLAITCKRKNAPRLAVPALSVGIAGEQTGIYPSEVPGGWQIIGRTPIPIFDTKKEHPFLFQAGDQVRFQPISKKEFVSIQKDIAGNSFKWETVYG